MSCRPCSAPNRAATRRLAPARDRTSAVTPGSTPGIQQRITEAMKSGTSGRLRMLSTTAASPLNTARSPWRIQSRVCMPLIVAVRTAFVGGASTTFLRVAGTAFVWVAGTADSRRPKRLAPRMTATRERTSDFTELNRRITGAGLMRRRPAYYAARLAAVGLLLAGGWTAFALTMFRCSAGTSSSSGTSKATSTHSTISAAIEGIP